MSNLCSICRFAIAFIMPTAYANVVEIDYLICPMSVNIMHYTHTHTHSYTRPHSIYKILHKIAAHSVAFSLS